VEYLLINALLAVAEATINHSAKQGARILCVLANVVPENAVRGS
jgi:hypothetical protein